MKAPVKDFLRLRTIKLPNLTQYRNNFEVLVNLAFIVTFIVGLGILYVNQIVKMEVLSEAIKIKNQGNLNLAQSTINKT